LQDRFHIRRVIWSLLLVGLVVLTCLTQTMASRISAPANDGSASIQYASNADVDQAIQAPEDRCDKSNQLLNKTNNHSDGHFVFLLFVFIVLAYTAISDKVLFTSTEPITASKNRLHVTHCIFQE